MKRQKDWIGRSEGAFVDFKVLTGHHIEHGNESVIRVFTTRIDTIYGVNAIVLAAEHPIVKANLGSFSPDVVTKIDEIVAENLKPKDRDEEIEKDGIDTGLKAVNPFSGEEVPVWVGNYVMMDYGTGALMSVPAHDERDFEFAKKFGLPIRQVISEPHLVHEHHTMQALALEQSFGEYGILVHSDFWNGKTSEKAKAEMAEYAVKHGFGEAATTYRLRDWGISRQRFWGSPIPMIYCDSCGVVPEKYKNLPVELPENAPFTGKGESPLAKVPEFYETTCPKCDGPAKRETDTMDTFVDSSWYFFRYLDPKNSTQPFEPEIAAYWTPVDQYIGGDDHAVMHLIYTRFWTKVMRDIGLVQFDEPVKRLLTQGMVVGETFFADESGKKKYYMPLDVTVTRDAKGKIVEATSNDGRPLRHAIERMSKSKGNGVDPDEMIEIYGADAARIFVLFAAPIENELVWHESGIEGAVRFLQRVWRVVWKWHGVLRTASPQQQADSLSYGDDARKLRQKTHKTIKRVGESFESLQFNTPVAALMELSNTLTEFKVEPSSATAGDAYAVREAIESLALMLTPFAPHTAEELYSVVAGNEAGLVANGARFPEFSAELAKSDEIEIPVQVNGKLRVKIMVSPDISDDDLRETVIGDEKVQEYVAGKEIVKIVVVPKRLVSIVVKG